MEQKATNVYKSCKSSYMGSFVAVRMAIYQNMLVADR